MFFRINLYFQGKINKYYTVYCNQYLFNRKITDQILTKITINKYLYKINIKPNKSITYTGTSRWVSTWSAKADSQSWTLGSYLWARKGACLAAQVCYCSFLPHIVAE